MCRVRAGSDMRRRRFLAALGGGASLGLGGLLAYRAGRTRTLSVASVETYDAAFHIDDRPRRRIRSTDSLDRSAASAVASAVDGGYETADPAPELASLRDRTEFVRHDGATYRLSDTFPGLVVTAEETNGTAGNGSVASADRFYETVGRHADVDVDGFLARARTDGVVERDPDPRFREFFDDYDAVEMRGRRFRFSTTYRDSGAPYSLTVDPISEAAVRTAGSVALSHIEEPARSRFRDAIDDLESEDAPGSSPYGLVDPSPDLVTNVRAAGRIRADGTVYDVDAWPLDHLPLSVTAAATESGIGFKDPGRIALTLENTGDRPLSVYGGSPQPFGRLQYRPIEGGKARYLYSTDERTSTLWPTARSHDVGGRDDELGSGQRRRAEYALGGDARGVPPGTYAVHGSLRVDGEFRGGSFPFRVVVEIE